jgi:hypothetical protein
MALYALVYGVNCHILWRFLPYNPATLHVVTRLRSRDLFPTDDPIPAHRMIGRGEDVEELVRSLGNGVHRIITGPRRTGKTSVGHAALGRLREAGLYVVAVDLFEVSDAAELAEALVAGTVANRPAVYKALHKLRRAGELARKTVDTAAVMKLKGELGEEIEFMLRPGGASSDPDRFLKYALDIPQRIAETDQRQLIVFLDEFQEIARESGPYGDPDVVTKRLRAVAQRSPRVTFLVAGSIEHLMRDLFTTRRRAFFQFGSFLELAPIAPEEWREGLRNRFAEDGCSIDDFALARLVELGELHPRATMLIAQQTHDASVAFGTQDVDSALVEQGFAAARAGDRPNHELTITRIRDWRNGTNAMAVAKRVARGEPTYGDLETKTAQRAVNALRDAGIIESSGRGAWRITDPLLRRYLADLEPTKVRSR